MHGDLEYFLLGSLYTLVIVAGLGLRVSLGNLTGDITEYGNILRWPKASQL